MGPSRAASDICGIEADLYLCLAAVREGVMVEGPTSRSAFRPLGLAEIGQRYDPADEDLVGNVQGKGVGGVDWGVYALGRSSFLCLDLARVRPGS